MRDINRIPSFLQVIECMWKQMPDLRFGQLMFAFDQWLTSHNLDMFQLEEENFLFYFEQFVKENNYYSAQ